MEDLSVLSFDNLTDSDIDKMFEEAVAVQITDKGVGYCLSVSCEDYMRSNFLIRYEGPFTCTACKATGRIVEERGIPCREPDQLYGEVRVEYAYCPSKDAYQEIAVVRDDGLGSGVGTYTAQMPTVATPKRAMRIAEALLAVLNDGIFLDNPHEIPRHHERVLNLDAPLEDVKKWLRAFELRTKDNPFFHKSE